MYYHSLRLRFRLVNAIKAFVYYHSLRLRFRLVNTIKVFVYYHSVRLRFRLVNYRSILFPTPIFIFLKLSNRDIIAMIKAPARIRNHSHERRTARQ